MLHFVQMYLRSKYSKPTFLLRTCGVDMDGSGVSERKKSERDMLSAYPVRMKKENRFSHPLIADGDLHQFRCILGAELLGEVLAVGLNGLHAEEHPVGNLLIGATVYDVAQ